VDQPKNLEEINKIIEQKQQQKERPSSMIPFAFIIIAVAAFGLFYFLFRLFFNPTSGSQIFSWFIIVAVFVLLYVFIAVFLLNSKILSDKDKNTLRKILFLTSPAMGWGVSSQDYKENQKFWIILPFVMLFLGVILFLLTKILQ
jgi:glucan phosphoethanolaminetransferase (alkaline phosphatase superfamily)